VICVAGIQITIIFPSVAFPYEEEGKTSVGKKRLLNNYFSIDPDQVLLNGYITQH
jgi:hypothetical protein